jgi:hypothetical protein
MEQSIWVGERTKNLLGTIHLQMLPQLAVRGTCGIIGRIVEFKI